MIDCIENKKSREWISIDVNIYSNYLKFSFTLIY